MTRYNAILARQRQQHDQLLAAAIKSVMRTPEGRRLFHHILLAGGVYRPSSPGEDRAYVAGRRDATLEIVQAVNTHAGADARKALDEWNERIESDNAELKLAADTDRLEEKPHA